MDERSFHRGIIYAANELIRTHDQPTMAWSIMQGADIEMIYDLAMEEEYDKPVAKLISEYSSPAERFTRKRRRAMA
jgi:hypothetical protein